MTGAQSTKSKFYEHYQPTVGKQVRHFGCSTDLQAARHLPCVELSMQIPLCMQLWATMGNTFVNTVLWFVSFQPDDVSGISAKKKKKKRRTSPEEKGLDRSSNEPGRMAKTVLCEFFSTSPWRLVCCQSRSEWPISYLFSNRGKLTHLLRTTTEEYL